MKYSKTIYYNTLISYKKLKIRPIQYTVCRNFNHISRYKGLRQIIHNPDDRDRFIALETMNPFSSNLEFMYYDVPYIYENRLDIIANKFYGSAQYSWIISYFNDIEDGFTVLEGQRLKIIKNFTELFNNGELLAPIPPLTLNLGTE